jgi:hypothetical protein
MLFSFVFCSLIRNFAAKYNIIRYEDEAYYVRNEWHVLEDD